MDPFFEFQSTVKPDVLDPSVVAAVGVAWAGIGIGFADDAFGDDSSGVALQGILQFFTAAPGAGGYDNGIGVSPMRSVAYMIIPPYQISFKRSLLPQDFRIFRRD